MEIVSLVLVDKLQDFQTFISHERASRQTRNIIQESWLARIYVVSSREIVRRNKNKSDELCSDNKVFPD